jgi:hypothetical protein
MSSRRRRYAAEFRGGRAREQVEGDEAGFAGEDAVELGFQIGLARRGRSILAKRSLRLCFRCIGSPCSSQGLPIY